MKKVVVGISGGVDSSVAAFLLKQQGYDVIGLFMINWHDTTGTLYGDCSWKDDLVFAELVAKKIGIPCYTVDLSDQYRKRVVDYMFAEYEKGRTPNPDVLCNREIKFDLFVDAAKQYGADYVATGHYSRKEIINKEKPVFRLLAGVDSNKDQSYFLCQLSQKQLSTALFPIGHLQKPEVRRIAEENGLATAKRKDSQGICFVGKVDLPVFLQQKIRSREGDIIEIPANSIIYSKDINNNSLGALSRPWKYNRSDGFKTGTHQGANYYTIGQRKGLNVGGKERPLFVISIDVDENIVYVGQGEDHPGLFRNCLFIKEEDVHWIRPDLALKHGESQQMTVRIRYRQPLQIGVLHCLDNGIYVVFENMQRGITPGQFAAWYLEDELIGSGIID
jgi:tRNA-uridine 2-sulfurtransferase